ncbi:hypothetical protein KC19_11G039400 [Ceratodon purpureus]|uniref:Uncharacterized protein n=1 Tax=Ceratodon purpureus TaxID=3225 RepID=A0A8T0GD37_CERPU|nr:hypothetical protein KC19_11G039400 [Ceratodon purpureus]
MHLKVWTILLLITCILRGALLGEYKVCATEMDSLPVLNFVLYLWYSEPGKAATVCVHIPWQLDQVVLSAAFD